MNPTSEKKSLLDRLLPVSTPKLKIAFLYAKTPATSAWTYAHELGRLHLEQTFPEEVTTECYENLTQDLAGKSNCRCDSKRMQYYLYNNTGICAGKCTGMLLHIRR